MRPLVVSISLVCAAAVPTYCSNAQCANDDEVSLLQHQSIVEARNAVVEQPAKVVLSVMTDKQVDRLVEEEALLKRPAPDTEAARQRKTVIFGVITIVVLCCMIPCCLLGLEEYSSEHSSTQARHDAVQEHDAETMKRQADHRSSASASIVVISALIFSMSATMTYSAVHSTLDSQENGITTWHIVFVLTSVIATSFSLLCIMMYSSEFYYLEMLIARGATDIDVNVFIKAGHRHRVAARTCNKMSIIAFLLSICALGFDKMKFMLAAGYCGILVMALAISVAVNKVRESSFQAAAPPKP